MDQEMRFVVLSKMKIEGNLKREISANIKRLKDIKAYPWHSPLKTPSSWTTN